MANDLTKLLPKAGELTPTGWKLPDRMTQGEWTRAGAMLARVEGAMMWWIGDWWVFGEHRYGARKELVEDEDWAGPSFQTCMQCCLGVPSIHNLPAPGGCPIQPPRGISCADTR